MPTVCLQWNRSCAKCDHAMLRRQVAKCQKRDAELHAIQWLPEILDMIRYMVRMDILQSFGATIKASSWRAIHEELLALGQSVNNNEYGNGCREMFYDIDAGQVYTIQNNGIWAYRTAWHCRQRDHPDFEPKDITLEWFDDFRDGPIFSSKNLITVGGV